MPDAACLSCDHSLHGHGPQGCAECLRQESAGTRNLAAVCGRIMPAAPAEHSDALTDLDYSLDTLIRLWRDSLVLLLVGAVLIGGTYLLDPDLSAPISRPLAVGTAICLTSAFVLIGARSIWGSVARGRARSEDGGHWKRPPTRS